MYRRNYIWFIERERCCVYEEGTVLVGWTGGVGYAYAVGICMMVTFLPWRILMTINVKWNINKHFVYINFSFSGGKLVFNYVYKHVIKVWAMKRYYQPLTNKYPSIFVELVNLYVICKKCSIYNRKCCMTIKRVVPFIPY